MKNNKNLNVNFDTEFIIYKSIINFVGINITMVNYEYYLLDYNFHLFNVHKQP
jgi:hypothetical protein